MPPVKIFVANLNGTAQQYHSTALGESTGLAQITPGLSVTSNWRMTPNLKRIDSRSWPALRIANFCRHKCRRNGINLLGIATSPILVVSRPVHADTSAALGSFIHHGSNRAVDDRIELRQPTHTMPINLPRCRREGLHVPPDAVSRFATRFH